MINFIFLIIIFLFMAIEIVCAYKFFRLKKIIYGILSTIYFLITLILTLSYFSIRDVTIENELESLIRGLTQFNLFAILILLLNIGMIIISTISYIKIIKLERAKKNNSKSL